MAEEMKTIIAGSRSVNHIMAIMAAIGKSGLKIKEVVSGGAKGADALGEVWANANKTPVKKFPADWDKHGKAAGPIRNKQMAEYADALIAVWDGKSKGTKNMIETMRETGKPVFVYKI